MVFASRPVFEESRSRTDTTIQTTLFRLWFLQCLNLKYIFFSSTDCCIWLDSKRLQKIDYWQSALFEWIVYLSSPSPSSSSLISSSPSTSLFSRSNLRKRIRKRIHMAGCAQEYLSKMEESSNSSLALTTLGYKNYKLHARIKIDRHTAALITNSPFRFVSSSCISSMAFVRCVSPYSLSKYVPTIT